MPEHYDDYGAFDEDYLDEELEELEETPWEARRRERRERAAAAIVELLQQEHAVVLPELIARLSDRAYSDPQERFDPHVVTDAKNGLAEAGIIAPDSRATRGGRAVEVWSLTDQRLRKRAIADASARKRLLQTRYHTWATGTASVPGVLGATGERVLYDALSAGAPRAGFRLEKPDGPGDVRTLWGQTIPGGPVDSVATMPLLDDDGRARGNATVVIEVKNIREWIYPTSEALHQLLHKAAQLQLANPNESILPVIVCRRAHTTAFRMALDLGFHIVELRAQFLPELSTIPEDQVVDVRKGLGYLDLRRYTTRPFKGAVKLTSNVLPKVAAARVKRWREVGSGMPVVVFAGLRDHRSTNINPRNLLHALRLGARTALGADARGGW